MGLTTYRLDRDGAENLLVLMHGWSAEQHHLAAYVPLVDPGERFTAWCPRAPHDLDDGDGASWFERTPDGSNWEPSSFQDAVAEVDALVDEAVEATGTTRERCVLGGFSQGGFLALALAGRRGAPRYGGVWAMCCALPVFDGLDLDLAGAAGTPALVQYGERDAIIPPERCREAVTALGDAGWDVTAQGYDMAHDQRIEMMADAREWLARRPG